MKEITRLWEIDSLRGVAIMMMIVFHTVFDLNFLAVLPVNVASGFWRYFAYATASLFLLIVGISLTLSRARAQPDLAGPALTMKFLRRGAGIFCLGLLVTLGTWLYLGEGYVIFGILHLIGVSVMLSPLFFRFGRSNILIGLVAIGTGWLIHGTAGPLLLLPLGIMPPGFSSVDYTPLFPWFGMVLIGMGTGSLFYPAGKRAFSLPGPREVVVRPLTFLGRHSLAIYLVHQPVIILCIGLVTGTTIL
jgi:uncharacterized membrane protein